MKTQYIRTRYFVLILSFFWTLISFTTIAQETPVAQNGQLKVCGTQLCNQYNKPIQLRGMSTHGIQWYGWGNCLTESSLDALAYDWDADILRISLYVQEGGYETDPVGFTNQVNRLIEEATARGMYALVDWHQLNPGDPNYNLENAKRFFTDIANQHKNKNNIIYDVCNEPNGSGVTWNRIKTYADQIIPVIQSIDNDAVVLVGTHGWSTFGVSGQGNLQDVINNPLQFDNVMYTFHFYAKSHGELYLNRLDEASSQLPVFVTEFGSQEASGDGPNDFVMTQRFIDLMQQKKISWTSWNYSDDFRTGAVWQSGTCSGGPWTTDRLKSAGSWIRDKIKFPADNFPGNGGSDTQSPYAGTPRNIPGKIEAENYDLGGQNIAFNELSDSNEGGEYRNDAVDIEVCSEGGYNIGWIKTGEWLEYTVNVETAKTYTLESRVAAISSGRKFHIEVDGQKSSGQIDVPNTGGWQNWQTVTTSVTLNKGVQVVRVVMDSDDFNLNYLIFKNEENPSNQSPTVVITSPQQGTSYTAGQTLNISANANDIDGNVTKVEFFVDNTKISEDISSPYTTDWTAITGNHTIRAVAIDNDDAITSSTVDVIVQTNTGGGSCDVDIYSQNGNYAAGNQVQNNGSIYECKPWPFSGWCSGNSSAYAPGTGTHWEDAWIIIGYCTARTAQQETYFTLTKNYPNPFDEVTNFQLELTKSSTVAFTIYSHIGNVVKIQSGIKMKAGIHDIPINFSGLKEGMYFCKILIDGKEMIHKVIKE
ncbi:cellulase family glycosylhydrolase [Aquimarina algiphila]|uniref:cellulase family glycosylhydrolase n=1 Tax=Aquimarina algiphila TaxID=2047982 RepID=UPI00232DEAC1|nr:cellulase family glycosylhydrolase [Aquimarina algiphila]